MTEITMMSFICQKCQCYFESPRYDRIDTADEPELMEKVRTADMFSCKCPGCGKKFFFEYPLLYKEPQNGIMILSLSGIDEDTANEQAARLGIEEMADMFPYRRVVYDRDHLIEKLFIFDAGLDDNIVENRIKPLILSGLEANEEITKPIAKLLFERREDGTCDFAALIDEDEDKWVIIDFPQNIYDTLAEEKQ